MSHELTLSERVLIAAIEDLIEAEGNLAQAKSHADSVTAGLAPEGADGWMADETVRVQLVAAGEPITPATLRMMDTITQARAAIVAAYHGGELPTESQIPGRPLRLADTA